MRTPARVTSERGLPRIVPVAVAALVVVAGAAARLKGLPSLLLFGDEFHSITISRFEYFRILRSWDFMGSGIALPLLQRIALDLLGPGLLAFRFPVVAAGLLTLPVAYGVARGFVGRAPAAITTMGVSANALLIYYSHFSRSYSLAVLAALVLLHALRRAIEDGARGRRWWAATAMLAALLPYLHLSSVGFVLSAAAGAALRMRIEKRSLGEWRWLLGAFAAGGLLCAGLYLPAWRPTWVFIRIISHFEVDDPVPFGVIETATLLTGSVGASIVFLVGVPVASFFMLRLRTGRAVQLVAAVFLPIAFLVVAEPFGGGVFQYARYLLTALPFMWMLLSWALTSLVRQAIPARGRADVVAILSGAFLVGLSFWLGPLGRDHVDDGPYANCPTSVRPLRALDFPYPGAPAFYDELAAMNGSTTVVEAPALVDRSLLLYRNYYLRHRKPTLAGFFDNKVPSQLTGPFVDLTDLPSATRSGADFLIVHTNVREELLRFAREVRARGWERNGLLDESSFMELLLRPSPLTSPAEGDLLRLRRELGAPVYEGPHLMVWRLAASARPESDDPDLGSPPLP